VPEQLSTREFEVTRQLAGGETLTLSGEEVGDGPAVVLLHGLTSTRRGVVHGSRHLARRGFRLIAYDARGHGDSSPAPDPSAYEYSDLVGDLEAVIAHFGIDRPMLVGSSMGAATAMTWTLENRRRVPALVQVMPAYTGDEEDPVPPADFERIASALEEDGVEGFVEASRPKELPEEWREMADKATRQRMERNRHLDAIADALRVVPGSRAFDGIEALESLEVPTLVVGDRDEADALHPLSVAEEYARRLPHAELLVEEEGKTPLAWQGARLSRAIGDFLEQAGALAVQD
jgi:pimeloyl-ACP methyl ester carboxylesterase